MVRRSACALAFGFSLSRERGAWAASSRPISAASSRSSSPASRLKVVESISPSNSGSVSAESFNPLASAALTCWSFRGFKASGVPYRWTSHRAETNGPGSAAKDSDEMARQITSTVMKVRIVSPFVTW